MRRVLYCLLALPLLAFGLSVRAQQGSQSPYKVEFNPSEDVIQLNEGRDGKKGVHVLVKFAISLDSKDVDKVEGDYKLVIEENGKRVKVVDLPTLSKVTSDLSVIMALDTSGSMKTLIPLKKDKNDKPTFVSRADMARKASDTFLGALPARAECGLVLFDHEIRKTLPPMLSRPPILKDIAETEPRGGTAFRDAAYESIKLLSAVPKGKDRALVLLTDGADVNSDRSLDEVIAFAKDQRVRIYTIGIGNPGKGDKVNTALVLDRSGSMELPADDNDLATPKIKALHAAGKAFLRMASEDKGRISLIPFSSTVDTPRTFTTRQDAAAKKKANPAYKDLNDLIQALTPQGETAMLDAVYTGIAALQADGASGKRAVVAMTDGIDNSSRRRVEEVIDRAREADIRLYLLGFGRKNEIDTVTMERMANETKGKYFYAGNKDALVKIFEELSIELHDDGIDEETLTRLAKETGGAYYPAQDVSKLQFILEQVGQSIQRKGYEIEFPSLNPRNDGSLRRVALRLIHGGGDSADPGVVVGTGGYQVHGLIIAEMHPVIYLVLLAVLVALILLPALIRRPASRAA